MKILKSGNIHQRHSKLTSAMPIRDISLPRRVALSMSQHTGNPAIPAVSIGDNVRRGQIVGNADGFVSANIHTPISGTVKSIGSLPDHTGRDSICITIEASDADHYADLQEMSDARPILNQAIIDTLTPQQIIEKIRDAGIISPGPEACPTHVKLTIPESRHIDVFIINGAACDPYLTVDERLMIEMPCEIAAGAELLRRASGANRGIIAIGSDKTDAITSMTRAVNAYPALSVVTLRAKHPPRSDNHIAEKITRRRIPRDGAAIDIGAAVDNVATALAAYHAIYWNIPLIERVITVSGDLTPYGNLRIPIGCDIANTLQHLGGIPDGITRIVAGGRHNGSTISHTEAPVTKSLTGILMLTDDEIRHSEPCPLRCLKAFYNTITNHNIF